MPTYTDHVRALKAHLKTAAEITPYTPGTPPAPTVVGAVKNWVSGSADRAGNLANQAGRGLDSTGSGLQNSLNSDAISDAVRARSTDKTLERLGATPGGEAELKRVTDEGDNLNFVDRMFGSDKSEALTAHRDYLAGQVRDAEYLNSRQDPTRVPGTPDTRSVSLQDAAKGRGGFLNQAGDFISQNRVPLAAGGAALGAGALLYWLLNRKKQTKTSAVSDWLDQLGQNAQGRINNDDVSNQVKATSDAAASAHGWMRSPAGTKYPFSPQAVSDMATKARQDAHLDASSPFAENLSGKTPFARWTSKLQTADAQHLWDGNHASPDSRNGSLQAASADREARMVAGSTPNRNGSLQDASADREARMVAGSTPNRNPSLQGAAKDRQYATDKASLQQSALAGNKTLAEGVDRAALQESGQAGNRQMAGAAEQAEQAGAQRLVADRAALQESGQAGNRQMAGAAVGKQAPNPQGPYGPPSPQGVPPEAPGFLNQAGDFISRNRVPLAAGGAALGAGALLYWLLNRKKQTKTAAIAADDFQDPGLNPSGDFASQMAGANKPLKALPKPAPIKMAPVPVPAPAPVGTPKKANVEDLVPWGLTAGAGALLAGAGAGALAGPVVNQDTEDKRSTGAKMLRGGLTGGSTIGGAMLGGAAGGVLGLSQGGLGGGIPGLVLGAGAGALLSHLLTRYKGSGTTKKAFRKSQAA